MTPTFTVLPAIDVADGAAVRPLQGQIDAAAARTDALAAALGWQAVGATWIHLVDLDAAYRQGSNAPLLTSIIEHLDLRVQLSGGVTDERSLTGALASGCDRVVLGTAALNDPAWCTSAIGRHRDRIAIGLDVRVVEVDDGSIQHRLAPRGSDADPADDLWETLRWLTDAGATRYVVTDVSADGMLSGPNIELCRSVSETAATPVIASGGIATVDDLVALSRTADLDEGRAEQAGLGRARIEGAIVGAALHAGRFTLPDALHALST